jgi:hypothetical protein
MNRRELLGVAIGGASLAIAAETALADEHTGHTAYVQLRRCDPRSRAELNCLGIVGPLS